MEEPEVKRVWERISLRFPRISPPRHRGDPTERCEGNVAALHKLRAGLFEMHTLAGSKEALGILTEMVRNIKDRTDRLTFGWIE